MNDLKVKLVLEALDRLTQPVRQMASRIRSFASQMSASFRSVGQSLRNVGKSMNEVGKQMSLKLTAPLVGLGFASIRTAAQFETYRASLKTVTGSQEKANQEFERLIQFTSSTPFQLEEVMRSYIKLVSLGLDPSEEAMRSFGNTASAMTKPLEQMVEAVADAVTGEFERLKEFGIKARTQGNVVALTFQGVTTKIRNNASSIEEYLRSIGEEKFGDAMSEQMKTLSGTFSNFSDAISQALNKLGNVTSKVLEIQNRTKELSTWILNMVDAFSALPKSMQSTIIYGALLLAILGPILVVIGQLAMGFGIAVIGLAKFGTGVVIFSGFLTKTLLPALWGVTAATAKMGAAFLATPIGWIVAGIAALAVAGFLIIKNWDKIKEFWNGLWDGIVMRVNSAAQYIMPIIDSIANGMNFITDNPLTRGISSAVNFVNGGNSNSENSIEPTRNKVDTGGELRITINEDRKATVSATMNDQNVNTVIDQGILMGAAL